MAPRSPARPCEAKEPNGGCCARFCPREAACRWPNGEKGVRSGCLHCDLSRRAIIKGLGGAAIAGVAAASPLNALSSMPHKTSLPVIDFHAHIIEPSLIDSAAEP